MADLNINVNDAITVTESLSAMGSAVAYKITSIGYFPFTLDAPTTVSLVHNSVSAGINIPFDLFFFGEELLVSDGWQFYIGSNGLVGFDSTSMDTALPTGTIPNNTTPDYQIFGYWHDLDPSAGGVVRYQVIAGQVLVIEFNNVPEFGNPETSNTFQICIFNNDPGNDNRIEIFTLATSNELGANSVQGLQNGDSTIASALGSRNYQPFTLASDAVQFSWDYVRLINVADAITVSEDITVSMKRRINVFDAISVTENVTFHTSHLNIFVFDNVTVNDTEDLSETIPLSIFDSVSVSDLITGMDIFRSSMDLPATLITSGYKWLTQSLLAAQQQFTTQPYFTAQIIDDSIKPTGVSSSPVAPYSRGAAATTPDDYIVAAGFGNADNHIHFYKTRNLANGWDIDITLDTDPSILTAYANNQVAIAVSDPVNGSYHIDVAYFANFDGSQGGNPNLIVRLQRSEDGGATWTLITVTPSNLPWVTYNAADPPNLYIALMKPRLELGIMTSAFIYPQRNTSIVSSGYTTYKLTYFLFQPSGGFYVDWGSNVDSGDWTIHSFDSYFLNGVDYLIFSGFRNIIDVPNAKSDKQNPNYALWITAALRRATVAAPTDDLWLPPINIIPADSATFVNQNQYIYPRASVQNGFVDVLFKALTVDSVSQSAQGANASTITTHENYMLMRSKDGQNFQYPQIMVDSSANEILEFSPTNQLQSFVKQDNLYYMCGGSQSIQFIFNDTVADITTDVIGYTIAEVAGQPSSINLKLANQDNQWVGASPTNPGASAIIKNSKIVIWQGFYNSDGVAELVPRNIYYIDDINQQVTSNQNDVQIIGRDWFKKLKTLITRFSLQWVGPYFYSDIFDGTTLSNWNQQTNSWIEDSDQIVTSDDFEDDSIITFARSAQVPFGSTMIVNATNPFVNPTGGSMYIYAFYIDQDHFLRLNITYTGGGTYSWAVELGIATGNITVLDNGIFTWTGDGYLSFMVRQYDYYKWNFLFTAVPAFVGNPLASWNSATLLKNTTNGEFNPSQFLSTADFQKPWAVGLGCKNIQVPFGFFRYSQFGPVTNILSVIKALSARAGIFDSKVQNNFTEPLIDPQFSGDFKIYNRRLVVQPDGTAIDINPDLQIGNGELIFTARVQPAVTDENAEFGFSFIFRADDDVPDNAYQFRIQQHHDGNGFVSCRFERVALGTTYIFPNSSADDQFSSPMLGSLNIDLTKNHVYKITMVDGWMYAYIDGVMVAVWNDNNTDLDFLTDGFWGFKSNDSNSTVFVKDIYSPIFWKPVQTFSFNPGDDAENAVLSLVQSIRGWVFSDLIGRMKIILLSTNDTSEYTYENQLWNQSVDSSDKEYVSQVTVYGTGVAATARDTTLMSGVSVRDAIVVDYSITTQSDAQVRANNELLNINQYRNQFSPKQVINVGAELFDAITVINTGNNTTGVDSPSRVYAQTINEGGGNNTSDYSLVLQTGNL